MEQVYSQNHLQIAILSGKENGELM